MCRLLLLTVMLAFTSAAVANEKTTEFKGIESNTYLIKRLAQYDDPRKARAEFERYREGSGELARKEKELADNTSARAEAISNEVKKKLMSSEVAKKIRENSSQVKGLIQK